MISSDTGPPDDLPEGFVIAVDARSDRELGGISCYLQRLRREQPSITGAIELRRVEEPARVADRGAYAIAVGGRPGETGETRGPFTYGVGWKPRIDDEGGRYKRHRLGTVDEDAVATTTTGYTTSSIIGTAHDSTASTVVFTPGGGSRWRNPSTSDVIHDLTRSSDSPIPVLPDRGGRSVSATRL